MNKVETFLSNLQLKIRDLAFVIDTLVSLFTGMPFGKLYYRNLEKEQILVLKGKKGNYNAKLHKFGKGATNELQWWLRHIPLSNGSITLLAVDFILTTDASEQGWGATNGSTSTKGRWADITNQHINHLQLKAIQFATKYYYKKWAGHKHLRIRSDNTTSIAYINNKEGTIYDTCNNLPNGIWKFCIKEKVWISAQHIPGSENYIADFMSQSFNDNTE